MKNVSSPQFGLNHETSATDGAGAATLSGADATASLAVWESYAQRLTPERRRRMEAVARRRQHDVRLVIHDIQHPHNVSACLRSAEAFGVQQVDVVLEKEMPVYRRSSVSKGVQRWLTIRNWREPGELIATLKKDGFRICAAFPAQDSVSLADIPVDQPIALVFGNEMEGLGTAWQDQADLKFHIPMLGFVESLNISVAAAVSLYTVTSRLAAARGPVTAHDQRAAGLLASWARSDS